MAAQVGKRIAVGGGKQAVDGVALCLVKLVVGFGGLDFAVCFHAYLVNHGKLSGHQPVVGEILQRNRQPARPVRVAFGHPRHVQVFGYAQ